MSSIPILSVALFSLSISMLLIAGAIVFVVRPKRRKHLPNLEQNNCVLLFESDELIDSSPSGSLMLSAMNLTNAPTKDILQRLDRSFKGIWRAFDMAQHTGTSLETIANDTEDNNVLLERWDNFTRLTFSGNQINTTINRYELDDYKSDAKRLQSLSENTPNPIWFEDSDGKTAWVNSSYLALVADTFGSDETNLWPIRNLFDLDRDDKTTGKQRIKLVHPTTDVARWFDVTTHDCEFGTAFFAVETTEIVRSNALRTDFLQTLTKTFASLSTGLAIFDKDRELILFNPALSDLVDLPFEFMASRPKLTSFLDRLRDDRILPEPKDYSAWRTQIAKLEIDAVNGTFNDNWELPDGRVFQVTGRPHPNGAIAFLFEDISAELSLTRQFKAGLEIAYGVIDTLNEALVVFTNSGNLAFSNKAYDQLCGLHDQSKIDDVTIHSATRQWQFLMKPTPIWGDIRDFAFQTSERSTWDGEVTHKNGRKYSIDVIPMVGGHTLIKFSLRSFTHSQMPQEFFHNTG